MVVVKSVNAQITETVDTTEGITNLHALHDGTVGIGVVFVVGCEHGSIHISNGVDVLCNVTTKNHVELTELQDRTGVSIEFPTLVLHVADVSPSQRGETCGGRNADAGVQQVRSFTVINVQVELEQVFKEVQVHTDVPGLEFFPTNLCQFEVGRNHNLLTGVLGSVRIIFIVHQTFAAGSVTVDTPTGCERQHADNLLERLEEFFITDVPTTGDTGEEAPFLTGTEAGATVGTECEVKDVLRTKCVVDRHRSTHGVTFSGAGPSVLEVTGNGGVSDATGDTGGTEILLRAAAGTHIAAGNVRTEGQLMTSVERKVLGFIAGSLVGSIVPLERGQGAGEEGFFGVGVGIHIDFTTIVQRSLVAVLAQELIFQLETGLNRVGRLMVPRFICNGDGVTVVHHVAEEVGRKTAVGINLTSGTCCGRHDVVFAGIVVHSVLVVILLTGDCHVRHGVVGTTEDV